MPRWNPAQITYRCQPWPPENKLYLPKGSTPISRMVVKNAQGKEMLVDGSIRTDEGDYACATGDTFVSLGGQNARFEYRKANFFDILRYKPWAWLQLVVTLLTFAGAVLGIVAAYERTLADPSKAFAYQTAAAVLVIALIVALGKLIIDLRSVK